MVIKMLVLIFFFEIKESKITTGHNFTLVKKNKLDWMLGTVSIFRGDHQCME